MPKSISKEGLRKITGTNTGEIKETSRSHGVLNNPPWELLRKIMGSKRGGIGGTFGSQNASQEILRKT